MRIIVTGGRDYKDEMKVRRVLLSLRPTYIHVGDCPTGVDLFVRNWCAYHHIQHQVWQAPWLKMGTKAGPWRNREMVKGPWVDPPLLVAFPGNKGTRDCIKHGINFNLTVLKVL